MKEYTFDNIQEFYDEMNNATNPKLRKMMVYAGYAHDYERQKKEKEITDLFENQYHKSCYFAHIISDSIAIVEEIGQGKTKWFFYVVDSVRGHEAFETYDEALIGAIAQKHNNTDATKYGIKLLIE